MTIKAWCDFHGVNEKSFYYWQRKFRSNACEILEQNTSLTMPSFAEINMVKPEGTQAIAATICVGELMAEIYTGAEPDTVESIIRTLKSLC